MTADYKTKIQAEAKLIQETLSLLDATLSRPRLEKPEWMAAAGFVFNVYAGVENVLKHACRARKIPLPRDSASTHRDLLDLVLSHGLLTADVRNRLDEYRAFRHFFVHGYGLMLDPKQLMPLAKGLPSLWTSVRDRILDVL